MYIKVINEDKVKLLVENNEIDHFEKINFDELCERTQNAIAIMLIKIYEQTGLNFFNSEIMIESMKGYCQSYYVIITRLTNCENNIKIESNEAYMYLFKLENIEQVIDFASLINSKHTSLKQSKLYKYRDSVYLCLYLASDDNNDAERLVEQISDKCTRCKWNLLNDVILQEWGCLLSDNIIENITAAV